VRTPRNGRIPWIRGADCGGRERHVHDKIEDEIWEIVGRFRLEKGRSANNYKGFSGKGCNLN
jgi:hypothetical protein